MQRSHSITVISSARRPGHVDARPQQEHRAPHPQSSASASDPQVLYRAINPVRITPVPTTTATTQHMNMDTTQHKDMDMDTTQPKDMMDTTQHKDMGTTQPKDMMDTTQHMDIGIPRQLDGGSQKHTVTTGGKGGSPKHTKHTVTTGGKGGSPKHTKHTVTTTTTPSNVHRNTPRKTTTSKSHTTSTSVYHTIKAPESHQVPGSVPAAPSSDNKDSSPDSAPDTLPVLTGQPESFDPTSIVSQSAAALDPNNPNATTTSAYPTSTPDSQDTASVIPNIPNKTFGIILGAGVGAIAAVGLAGLLVYRKRESKKKQNFDQAIGAEADQQLHTRWRPQSFLNVVTNVVAKLPRSEDGRSNRSSAGSSSRRGSQLENQVARSNSAGSASSGRGPATSLPRLPEEPENSGALMEEIDLKR
ncbi:hypothetical protein BC936DRAFT_148278 [Jimgerdemannia flammicorona]|uniref:Mid2 domain-containing protein n=1 Tax=Jimgerdemannia flammicorona TaxID=994334 RepID=A0A433D3G0_9FUNG|nr:hypothetical protein BC936DRAFT_148278 [Jimgerdemannia flammicorona]